MVVVVVVVGVVVVLVVVAALEIAVEVVVLEGVSRYAKYNSDVPVQLSRINNWCLKMH